MLAVPELVGRLGECAAQQTVSWGKLWNTASPQSWRLPCQGWSCQGLLMSVVPLLLGKESFPIHFQLSPNPILKYVMRQHRICNRVDSISLKSNLLPLLGKPGTWDIPVGKLPSEGDFLQLLHGEIEARGGTVSSREVKDLCCDWKCLWIRAL